MHTVELLEQALETARQMGYKIRHEWLGGTGGGACEFSGQKWIFVDLALNAVEQLEQVREALRDDPAVHVVEMLRPVQKLLGAKKAA